MASYTGASQPASAFHKVIDAGNKFDGDLDNMWKFFILNNSKPVGYMAEEFAKQMDWEGTFFKVCESTRTIHLNPDLLPGEDATEVCKQQFTRLCEINRSRFNGVLDTWLSRKPSFEAIRFLDSPGAMLEIPTPLRGIFGIVTAGVHLNVYTIIGGQIFMWVAKRSQTASYPGMMDQPVAGGMDPEDGYDAWAALEHEAWEEAGLVLDRTSQKLMESCHTYVYPVEGPSRISFYDRKNRDAGDSHGHIEPGVRFVFDVEFDPDHVFAPSTDDAVGYVILQSVNEVTEDMFNNKWKPNSALEALDFLLRKGCIVDDGDGTIDELRARLQRPLPLATE
ncbi:uncharacterized protein CRV24_008240 [Beauveria bassiana]|nr:uncharacterized protein CRV24_008240 [Beauveria bassiana]KAH8716308.1 Uncharacterized protein HC256_005081 [Beauveria bassiana]